MKTKKPLKPIYVTMKNGEKRILTAREWRIMKRFTLNAELYDYLP